jgi:hypothetical protein
LLGIHCKIWNIDRVLIERVGYPGGTDPAQRCAPLVAPGATLRQVRIIDEKARNGSTQDVERPGAATDIGQIVD